MIAALLAMARAAGLATRPTGRMPRAAYPHLLEVAYARLLLHVVYVARMSVQPLVVDPHITPARVREVIAAATSKVEQAVRALAPRVGVLAAQIADHQARQLDRQTRAMLGVPASVLGVADHTPAPHVRLDARKARPQRELTERFEEFVHENVALIRSLGTTPLGEVEQLISRGFANGDRHETIARALVERFGVAEDRARVIARDQVGKLNGRISADRHQKMGLKKFTWRDVGDARVRPAHRHLNGQVFAYAKPPSEGLPGEPILCRCHDEPVFDDILGELDRLEAAGGPAKAPKPPRAKRAAAPPKVAKPLTPSKNFEEAKAPPAKHPPQRALAIEAAARGDFAQASAHITDYLQRRGLVPSSAPNVGAYVSDEGMQLANHSGKQIQAAALRHWDGRIQLSTRAADELRDWGRDGRSESELRAASERLLAESDRKASEWRQAGPKRRAKLDPDRGERENREAADARRLLEGPRTLAHEALHGFSPLQPRAYQGHGGQIEEITTETMARVVVRDLFGGTVKPHNDPGGAYAADLTAATKAIAELTGKTPTESYEILQRSSERFKRRTDKISDARDVPLRFADDIAREAGIDSVSKVHAVLTRHLDGE